MLEQSRVDVNVGDPEKSSSKGVRTSPSWISSAADGHDRNATRPDMRSLCGGEIRAKGSSEKSGVPGFHTFHQLYRLIVTVDVSPSPCYNFNVGSHVKWRLIRIDFF